MEISGQIALVTGAGSGLGAATARRLAASGAKVVLVDRAKDQADVIATEIDGVAFAADVSDHVAMEAVYAQVTGDIGVPRIVVNCAGIGTAARILPRDGNLDFNSFIRTQNVNLTGTFITLSLAARAMSQAAALDADGSRGVIINTASVAYQDGQIGQVAYAASKGGIASMTLPAARELARFGIRVMTIAPGIFETAMSAGLPPEIRQSLEAGLPFPSRMGRADEYAQLVQAIVENQLLNGEVIRLDSAVRLAPK